MSATGFIFWSNWNPWLLAKAPRSSCTFAFCSASFPIPSNSSFKDLCSFIDFIRSLWLPKIWLVWASSFTNFLYITLTQPNRFHNGSYNLLSKIFTNKTKLGCYSLVMIMQAVHTAAFYYVKPMKQFFCHWIFHEQNGSKRWSVCCAIFKIVLFESTQSFKDPKTTSLSDSLYCLMFTNSIHYIHYSIDLLWLIPIQISINCRMSFNNRNTFISGLSTDIVTNLATSDGQMSSKFSASITNFVIC